MNCKELGLWAKDIRAPKQWTMLYLTKSVAFSYFMDGVLLIADLDVALADKRKRTNIKLQWLYVVLHLQEVIVLLMETLCKHNTGVIPAKLETPVDVGLLMRLKNGPLASPVL